MQLYRLDWLGTELHLLAVFLMPLAVSLVADGRLCSSVPDIQAPIINADRFINHHQSKLCLSDDWNHTELVSFTGEP